MDSAYDYNRDQDDEDDLVGEAPPPVIGTNERRMQVRAYEYWVTLLNGRPFPQIQDLDPESIADFGPHSVLLDFSRSLEDPTIAYLGRALREECNMIHGIRTVADVPRGSLVSRLTDHYLQIIANKAPVGFEAEFTNCQGLPTMYRGILMPLTSDGSTIDYVYGVINWKHGAPAALSEALEQEFADAFVADAGMAEPDALWPEPEPASYQPAPDAGLWDWLAAARISADEARRWDGRAHAALYAAIGRAHDFGLSADDNPQDFAELLESEGLKAQARAPMTPIVKLVFGTDYDKTRLTEYAAALNFARREGIGRGDLAAFLEAFEGGLKGVVRAQRAHQAKTPTASRTEKAREALRSAPSCATVDLETGDEEFVVLLARKIGTGRLAILAPVADASLVDQAVRKAAS